MSFPFYIARRYLFSRKRVGAINIISGISVGGVALATMAMVCVMSGFNGFRDLIGSLFTQFDPQIEIVPTKGKFIDQADPTLQKMAQHPAVSVSSYGLEDDALLLFLGRPTVIRLKGVDDNFRHLTNIDSILYGTGRYQLHNGDVEYAIPGIGLCQELGGVDFGKIQVCVPRRGERINLSNPIENINVDYALSTGVCFEVHQQKYDASTLLCSLGFAQRLFEQPEAVTSLSLKLKPDADEAVVKKELQQMAGKKFNVLDRYDQQEETFNVMKIEKLFAFFFLAFIVLVASFNIIGSLSMLIIDKRRDVETLRHLGASECDIVRIFLFEGRLITLIGAALGIGLGLLLCWGQQQFGWLQLGSADRFIVSAYPVSVHATDVLIIFLTVLAVGFVSVWYPVRYLSRRMLQ